MKSRDLTARMTRKDERSIEMVIQTDELGGVDSLVKGPHGWDVNEHPQVRGG